MDYTTEVSGPTNQINNIMAPAVVAKDTGAVMAQLSPFDQQRDMIVGHIANDYNGMTGEVVQTKNQADSVNDMKRYLKMAESKNKTINASIQDATKGLASSKHKLKVELAKQKIMFEILGILAVTIVVYIVMGSSQYVHGVALLVFVLGILYVLNYNAYRLHAIGSDTGAPALSSLADIFTPKGSVSSDYPWIDFASFFSPPNAPTP